MLQVQLAEAHASAAAAESREAIMEETLKKAEDRHVHQLRVAYLVIRAERRTLAAERQDAPILEGIPIHPPAPPPSEVSDVEPLIPLTQPSSREDVD